MRTFRKLLIGIGLAGVLTVGVIWGARTPASQHGGRAEVIVKRGHGMLAWEPQTIQKPGH